MLKLKLQMNIQPEKDHIILLGSANLYTLDLQSILGTTFCRSCGETDTHHKKEFPNCSQETHLLGVPDDDWWGRGSLEFDTIYKKEEELLTPNHFLMRRPDVFLKPIANLKPQLSIRVLKLTRTLLGHFRADS